MKKKIISMVSIAALSLTISTSAFASPGTVERSVNFRSAPSTGSSVYQLISKGSTVDILEKVNSYWLKVSYNGKVGYVSTDYISGSATPSTGNGTVTKSANFRSAPSTDSSVYRLLKTGTTFQVLSKVNNYWLHISVGGQQGYISTDYVSYNGGSTKPPTTQPPTVPSSAKADRIIAHAKSLIGKVRYEFGANRAPSVLDCSSFTKYVFGLEGVSMKWGTRFQKDDGAAVSKSNLQKGDLVFFWTSKAGTINHVGIYMGNGQFIHNSPSFNGVGISSLESGYWANHYISARRVL